MKIASLALVFVILVSGINLPNQFFDSSTPISNVAHSEGVLQAGNTTVMRHKYGVIPEKLPVNQTAMTVTTATTTGLLPPHWDWRDDNGNWMTPVEDQGWFCGACVAFAVIGATEAQYKISYHNPNWNLDLSEQALFSCLGGTCDKGVSLTDALDRLKNVGVPDADCYPNKFWTALNYPCSGQCSNWQSRAYRITSWVGVNPVGPQQVESLLMQGPLIAIFPVYDDFEPFFLLHPTGIYHWNHQVPSGNLEYHAVVIIGYDAVQQYWIVKNSWGSYWGDKGYFKMGWGEPSAWPIETWMAQLTVPRPSTIELIFGAIQLQGSNPRAFSFAGQAKTSPNYWITNLHWDFGDGSTLDSPYSGQPYVSETQSHVYATNGQFTVTLTARDSAGNIATFSSPSVVTPEFPTGTLTMIFMVFVALMGMVAFRGSKRRRVVTYRKAT